MRAIRLYITTIILLVIFLFLILWVFNPLTLRPTYIHSPLPSFLSLPENNQVSTINLWLPELNLFNKDKIEKPDIRAKSALSYDVTTGKTLYSKNVNERLPIASLTKIMTAIIALEHKNKDDRYSVLKQHLVGENSMGLTEGEVLSLEDLLYGLILHSGNDAAEVLAYHFPGGREAFIKAMNDKAISLGLKNTNFTNPSGLEGDGNQYSTAYDLLVITRYALENFPLFRKVVSTFEREIPYSKNHKYFYLQNETNLISSYSGVKGVKDGYTPEANLCLVTYLEYGGHKIIAVILGSNNRRQEMKDLLDYSLKSLGVTPPKHS